MRKYLVASTAAALGLSVMSVPAFAGSADASVTPVFNLQPFFDPTGAVATFNKAGRFDTKNAFFSTTLGTNGRNCATCHQADQAMSVTPPQIRQVFRQTRGKDPLFAAVDGANCPDARTGDAASHSLILNHGLVRTFIQIPATAQFTVKVVHDPYGCALTTDPTSGLQTVSEYRRPLPTTNLRFLSTMMFDGRESPATSALGTIATFDANLNADLTHQAQSAITTHFQGPTATPAQLADIVSFEMGLSTAQIWDRDAGFLGLYGATGGPLNLVHEVYYPGINDVLGADPNGVAFDPSSMTMYGAWGRIRQNADESFYDRPYSFGRYGAFDRARARRDIAAGEVLFNTAPLVITAVRGLNDNAAIGQTLPGTCTTCHDAPNIGHHSLPLPLDIGVGHTPQSGYENDPAIVKAMAELDEPDLPVYEITGCPNPFGTAPVSFYTTDLGKGAVTGKCGDMNRVKGPILRGLAARAPYFHNGAAASLQQAVNFYNQRFAMNLTDEQKRQLVAFLNSL